MWNELLQNMTCSHLGDENYYKRYLQKQCVVENKEAKKLMTAYNDYKELKAFILHSLELMKSFGLEVVKSVCESVIGMNSYDIQRMTLWSLCAISGAVCSECMCIQLKEPNGLTVTIDVQFDMFFRCLWLIFQAERIQVSRIQDFESNTPPLNSASLKDRIDKFNRGTKYDTTVLVRVLEKAESYVRESIETTLEQLQKNKED